MALNDVKDLVIRYDGHPRYVTNKIVEDDEIEVIVQKLEMILFTNENDVIGEQVGVGLEYYLWQTKVSVNTIDSKIRYQVSKYIPELEQLGYTLNVSIFEGTYRDIMYVNFVIKGYNIDFVFE
jgi:hypothetical protein